MQGIKAMSTNAHHVMKSCLACTLPLLLLACDAGSKSYSVLPPAEEIDSPARDHSSVPNLTADNAGTLLLTWTESGDTQDIAYYSALKDEHWSDPVKIATGEHWFVNWADVPGIAGDGRGNLIASFLVRSGTRTYGYNLNLVFSPDFGETWRGPVVPHDDRTQTEHGFASLLSLEPGRFFVAWLDGRNNTWGARQSGGSMGLRAAFVDANGTITYERPIDLRVCDCCQPTAVTTAHGPAVVYRDRSGDEIRDISIAWWENGNWTGPFPVARDNWKIDGCPVDGPKAAVLGGTLAVIWFTASGDQPKVNVAFSHDHGQSFAQPIRVDDGHAVGRADIMLLDPDTAIASWLEAVNDHGEIRIKKIAVDGSRGASVIISGMPLSRASGFPQMAAHEGVVYFAWSEGTRIRTARVRP